MNVERAVAVGARLGGHFVQGHVDGTGQIERIEQDGEWTTMWFKVPRPLTLQMVRKGSITVDGISLTLVEVEAERFSVALIPHTLAVTTLGQRAEGDTVNIETDILGKPGLLLLSEMRLAWESAQREHPDYSIDADAGSVGHETFDSQR